MKLSSFFACRGYALAALGALTFAAEALRQQTVDANWALDWVDGKGPTAPGDAPLTFALCVQAIGASSRCEELRSLFRQQPQAALARLLVLGEVLRGDDLEEGDDVDAELRAMRSYHLDPAPAAASGRLHPMGEAAC